MLDLVGTLVLGAVLVWLARVDLRERRLPDAGTLPLVALGLALGAWRCGGVPVDGLIGAALGYSVFAVIGAVYFRARGIEGLGLGDAKLMAALGAWLGWQALAPGVLLAALGALVWAVVQRQGRDAAIPFGPSLAGAFFALWLWVLMGGGLAGS
ncbi:MAG: prepilin peptidase [Shimia sp.]